MSTPTAYDVFGTPYTVGDRVLSMHRGGRHRDVGSGIVRRLGTVIKINSETIEVSVEAEHMSASGLIEFHDDRPCHRAYQNSVVVFPDTTANTELDAEFDTVSTRINAMLEMHKKGTNGACVHCYPQDDDWPCYEVDLMSGVFDAFLTSTSKD